MLELTTTDRAVTNVGRKTFWNLPTEGIRLKELNSQDILREGDVEIADNEMNGIRHLYIIKDALCYSASSFDRRIRRWADLTQAKAESFEELHGDSLIFGIRIARNRDQCLDLFFQDQGTFELWMDTLERVCLFHHFKEEYRLLYKIGSGHFGSVYAAHHSSSNITYAVKIYSKTLRSIVDNEIEILKSLRLPNISHVRKVYEDLQQMYVVMDLAPGVDLLSYLERNGPMKEKLVRKVVFCLAEILREVHAKGIIHRDLKPENIVVDIRKGSQVSCVTLIDFGLAVRVSHVEVGSCGGTAGYISPEQFRQEAFDTKADVFSLGIVAFTLISGENPFSARDERHVVLLNSRCKVSFERKEWQFVSQECVDFIKKLTNVSPSDRISAEMALEHPWLIKLQPKKCELKAKKVACELSSESIPTASSQSFLH